MLPFCRLRMLQLRKLIPVEHGSTAAQSTVKLALIARRSKKRGRCNIYNLDESIRKIRLFRPMVYR